MKDSEALQKCLTELENSDQRLAMGPRTSTYDWQFVFSEDLGEEGARVHFGVAWYDLEFFNTKKTVFENSQHRSLFSSMGIASTDIAVSHWIKAH